MTRRPGTLVADLRGALPRLVWLWVLWLLLWGSVSPLALVGGLVVSAVVTLAFPLPALSSHVTVRPVALLRLVGRLLVDLVTSAVTVARASLRRVPSRAVVEVPLVTDNDVLITIVADVATMTPGTLVLEIDRRRGRLYVHALPVRDEGVDYRRQEVRDVERRVLRAFAPKRDLDGRETDGGSR